MPVVVGTNCPQLTRIAWSRWSRKSSRPSRRRGALNRAKATAGGSVPPLADKAAADKKAGELREFGITDYFIVQEAGANRYAISLGVFSSEKGGQDRLAEVKGLGVRSARLSLRPGKDSHVTVDINGPETERPALRKAAAGVLPQNKALACQ